MSAWVLSRGPAAKTAVIVVVVIVVIACLAVGLRLYNRIASTSVVGYFDNTTGLYTGDRVKILGVDVGQIDSIDADGDKMKVSFHFDSSYKVPADVKAVVLSQSLISSRSIQLTPAYSDGPEIADGSEIPIGRTAVPVEWDDLRKQLEHLADSVGPTETNAAGALGGFVDTAADSLGGKGDQINSTLQQLSTAMSTLSDGRDDLFANVRNLQAFVTALSASDGQIVELNRNIANVAGVLNNSDGELEQALQNIDALATRLGDFVQENRDGLSKSVDDLAATTSALDEVRPDIEQLLHVAPTAFQNFYNIYQPSQGSFTGALAVTQFQNPVQFICGAIQSASQLGAAESADLCVQQLAPVLQLLQMNYPPVGINPVAGVQTRPDQVDYSEDWLRSTVPSTSTAQAVSGLDGLAGLLGLANPSIIGGGQ